MHEQTLFHRRIAGGIQFAGEVLPSRQVACVEVRVLAGAAADPSGKLGVAGLVAETADKGTARYDMVALADAFDRIGAQRWLGSGIESTSGGVTVLVEHMPRAIELLGEIFLRPRFPADQTAVQVKLARQHLKALEDNPTRKMYQLLSARAWGDVLGRNVTGNEASLDGITRDDLDTFWRRNYQAANLQIVVTGAFVPETLQENIEATFAALGDGSPPAACGPYEPAFAAGRTHVDKDCEQQQVGLAFRALPPDHDDAFVESVVVAILSGGMSARLFTEIREKRGLAYWVRADRDFRRGAGLIRLGAGTRPERAHETLDVLLTEVERLGRDVTEEELARAKTGLIASLSTRGDSTQARAGAVSSSFFYRGRPLSFAEREAGVEAVTVDDVRRYLAAAKLSPDELCILTLGPRPPAG